MNIDWNKDTNFVTKITVNLWEIDSLTIDQARFWESLKDRLNRQFFYEVFPQMFDGNWHCVKLAYVRRDNVDGMSVEFGIAGKILVVRERPFEMTEIPEMQFNVRGKIYMTCCSHCGCEWHPTLKGACSSCGADARSALQLEIPHA